MSRLILHASIHFLRFEDLLAVSKRDAHSPREPRSSSSPSRARDVGQKGFDALVHRLHRLPLANDNYKLLYFAASGLEG